MAERMDGRKLECMAERTEASMAESMVDVIALFVSVHMATCVRIAGRCCGVNAMPTATQCASGRCPCISTYLHPYMDPSVLAAHLMGGTPPSTCRLGPWLCNALRSEV
eukprot:365533-Chlamydomonas_euryale.AAC.5